MTPVNDAMKLALWRRGLIRRGPQGHMERSRSGRGRRQCDAMAKPIANTGLRRREGSRTSNVALQKAGSTNPARCRLFDGKHGRGRSPSQSRWA